MLFKTPSSSPVVPGEYVLRLDALEDAGEGPYGPKVRWVFQMWDKATLEPVTASDGTPYEWYQTTSQSTALKSTARVWLQAFAGRRMPERLTLSELEAYTNSAIGRFAIAHVDENERGYMGIAHIRAVGEADLLPEG